MYPASATWRDDPPLAIAMTRTSPPRTAITATIATAAMTPPLDFFAP